MKLSAVVVLLAILSYVAAGQNGSSRTMPDDFKSDGCTLFPDGNYRDCCVEHDKDYYFGGSLAERKASDDRLRKCVRSKGKGWKRKFLASAIWLGVRVGGVSFLPTPFRWGFGNKWPRKEPKKPKITKPKPATDR